MLSDLPDDLKAAIRTAYLQAHTKDEAAFKRLTDGKARPWEAVDNAAYDETIKLIQFVDQLRRRSS
jgi:phosphonate transport system substrate-binding protein